jgi:hypothetical protein
VLEKSDKCVGKRMRGRIVLDKKRIISNVWQLAVAVAVCWRRVTSVLERE